MISAVNPIINYILTGWGIFCAYAGTPRFVKEREATGMGKKVGSQRSIIKKSVAKMCHKTYDKSISLVFEWDEQKETRNIQKHGISFEIAAKAFSDPNRIELYDDKDYGEERFALIGYADKLLAVSYTMRGDVYRIISARLATKAERRRYENGN